MRVRFDDKAFIKDMDNIIKYSYGFLEGVQTGKRKLYERLGPEIVELASQYVDVNARVTPELLHHIYEWGKSGSPKARLFDIDYKINNLGITFSTALKQSSSIKNGSNVPFYDKATIMEKGVSVTILPKKANALRFEINGEEFYSKDGVVVDSPGGQTKGQFEKVIDEFFGIYFKQSFLKSSGLQDHFKKPQVFKKNIKAGKRGGRSLGRKIGHDWVANAGAVS